MAGLYIHVPFCLRKCEYCDFYSEAGRLDRIPAFLSALETECGRYLQPSAGMQGIVETVFFGGGTPSLLEPDQVNRFLKKVRPFFTQKPKPEITLEANPATLSVKKLKGYLKAGVNRISIGIQSFDDSELKLLGRLHSSRDAAEAVLMAKEAGFDNIGVDLIYAIPGQTLTRWEASLHKTISLQPDHISTYSLTWSYSTPLGKKIESGQLPKPSDDFTADLSLAATSILEKAGYEHYEISNYAKPGKRSRHNESYWNGKPYLGIGPSAHSLMGNKRFWNVYSIDRYVDLLKQSRLPIEEEELLSPEDRKLERLAVGLRRKEGVSIAELGLNEKKMALLVENGLAVMNQGMLSLTTKGMLLADEIAVGLV